MARPMPREPPVTTALLPVRSIMRGPPCGRGAGSPGTTSSSGTGGPRLEDGHQARRASGRPSPSRPARGRWRPARPTRRACRGSGSAVHSRATAPLREAGAEGDEHDLVADLDAARVDRLGEGDADRGRRGVAVAVDVDEHLVHRACPSPLATDSMIRTLAWWGMNRSISSGVQPARSMAVSADVARVLVA